MHHLALWGQHWDEYQAMFDLPSSPSNTPPFRLLEYGCGPTAINTELHQLSIPCISCDPLFDLNKDAMYIKTASRMTEQFEEIKKNKNQFDFTYYGNIENLIKKRRKGIEQFFADYEQGKQEQRYIPLTNHSLPFKDFSFDFALCAHYLFTNETSLEFHLNVIRELTRVSKDVRIFPLVDIQGDASIHLGPVLLKLQQESYGIELRNVNYHLQPNDQIMLRVWAQQCLIK